MDPKFKTYPYYSPYQFSGNRVLDAIELEGLEPKSIVKKLFTTSTITVYPEIDEPQEPVKLITKKTTYEYTKPAVHLLSLVSGISESEINKVDIRNADGTKIPAYDPKEGGGAMTLPTGDPNSYQIRLTNNFFDARKGTEKYIKSVDYSDDVMAWLELSSHEVGHIKDIQEIGNNVIKYMGVFVAGYANAKGHDGYWREPRADKGYKTFDKFNKFIDKFYGKDSLKKLFENPENIEKDIIDRVDQWWERYQKEEAKSEKDKT